MRYTAAESLALAPHSYQHDLVVPAAYIVVRPKKGHSTTFRIRATHSTKQAIEDCRKRGFAPLYVVRTKQPK